MSVGKPFIPEHNLFDLAGDLLGERARLTPEKTALVEISTNRRFTYRELNDRAARCALLWRERCHLEKGDRVGILARNRVEFLDAFFAAGKSGIVLVPLNTRLTPLELEYIIRDSGVRAVVYDGDFGQTVRHLKRAVTIEHWISLDDCVESADMSYQQVHGSAKLDAWTPSDCRAEDIHCLLYTSGTTGKPKGVMIPRRMVLWNAFNTVISWQLRECDIAPIFTPLFHAGGLSVFLPPMVAIGGTIVLHRGFDGEEICRTLEQEQVTVIFAVPTILKLLLDVPGFGNVSLRHVRWLISGGAPLPTYLIEEYHKRGVVLKQGYGLTEVGVNCFAMSAEESLRKPGSIGKPVMFTQAKLIGPAGSALPADEVGELLLRGPHLSKGYWNNPQETRAALDEDGWFRTGDLARCDAEGFFYLVGRRKEMFISGGENVYPAEIEQVLLSHPAIQDAAVIGVPDSKWGEVGVAYLVARTQGRVAPEKILEFIGLRLARYKLPKLIWFLDALPRNASGKIIKDELLARYRSAG
jgi:fatty-acyl-CoA synthase